MSDIPLPPRPPLRSLRQGTSELTLDDVSKQITILRMDINDRLDVFHSELSMVRQTMMADHAPRLTAVEKTAAAKVMGGAKWIGLVTLGLTIAAQVASSFRPDLVGPIQSLLAILTGGTP